MKKALFGIGILGMLLSMCCAGYAGAAEQDSLKYYDYQRDGVENRWRIHYAEPVGDEGAKGHLLILYAEAQDGEDTVWVSLENATPEEQDAVQMPQVQIFGEGSSNDGEEPAPASDLPTVQGNTQSGEPGEHTPSLTEVNWERGNYIFANPGGYGGLRVPKAAVECYEENSGFTLCRERVEGTPTDRNNTDFAQVSILDSGNTQREELYQKEQQRETQTTLDAIWGKVDQKVTGYAYHLSAPEGNAFKEDLLTSEDTYRFRIDDRIIDSYLLETLYGITVTQIKQHAQSGKITIETAFPGESMGNQYLSGEITGIYIFLESEGAEETKTLTLYGYQVSEETEETEETKRADAAKTSTEQDLEESVTEAQLRSTARQTDEETETETETESETGTKAEARTATATEPEPETEAEMRRQPETLPPTAETISTDAPGVGGQETLAEASSKPAGDTEKDMLVGTKSGSDTEVATEAASESKTAQRAESETPAGRKSESETQADRKPGSETEIQAGKKPGTETEIQAGRKTETEPETGRKQDSETKPGKETGAETNHVAGASSDQGEENDTEEVSEPETGETEETGKDQASEQGTDTQSEPEEETGDTEEIQDTEETGSEAGIEEEPVTDAEIKNGSITEPGTDTEPVKQTDAEAGGISSDDSPTPPDSGKESESGSRKHLIPLFNSVELPMMVSILLILAAVNVLLYLLKSSLQKKDSGPRPPLGGAGDDETTVIPD